MAVKKVPKNIKFEEALAELEAQVQQLESGKLPLEQALEVYQYGVALSKVCLSKLEAIKKEVKKVVEDEEGHHLETFQELEEEK